MERLCWQWRGVWSRPWGMGHWALALADPFCPVNCIKSNLCSHHFFILSRFNVYRLKFLFEQVFASGETIAG